MSERDDDRPGVDLRGLRDVVPPPSLVPGVMRKIAEPPPAGAWAWLWRRRRIELRFSLSPVGAGALALALIAFALPFYSRPERRPLVIEVPASAPSTAAEPTVLVRFVLVAKGAKNVAVTGDFNAWDPSGIALTDTGGGTFAATVPLPKGTHEYMFLVDGEWIADPAAPELRPDGFGRANGVLRL